MTEESLVVDRDCPAFFFVFGTFTFETPLGLVSVDRLSSSRAVLLSDCVVVLELRGSDTNGVEPEGRSSEGTLVAPGDPSETCWDLAASIKARTLFFLGLAMVGDFDWAGPEGGTAADSFCFFFSVGGGGDDCEGDAAVVFDSVCVDLVS